MAGIKALNSVPLVLAAVLATAQPSSVLHGRVVADEGGTPIRNARVAVAADAIGSSVVLTDEEGQFALSAPSRPARILVSKTGYGRVESGELAGGAPVEIRLRRAASITGRVTDAVGEPLEAARVVARRVASRDTDPAQASAFTNDRGEYRLSGLPPDTYVVSAEVTIPSTPERVGNGIVVMQRFEQLYFADASKAADATPLTVAAGEQRQRIDFTAANGRSGPTAIITSTAPLTRQPTAKNGERSTAIVHGRVVGGDGRGLANADVRLSSVADPRESVYTRADVNGTFEFRALPPGRYTIAAAKVGFELRLTSPAISVAEAQTVEGVEVALRQWASIAGRVLDEFGDPIQSAMVQALQIHYERGRRRLVSAGPISPTDDFGRYRVRGLAGGRYVVSASAGDVGSAELPGYARGFYPGTQNAGEAQFVSVADGQDLPSIDLGLSRSHTARISGRLLNSSGQPTSAGSVLLLPAQASSLPTFIGAGARITSDGRFEFTNVADGQYVIQISRGRLNRWTEGEFGAVPVAVAGADVSDLTIQTSSGSSIRGRFTFDSRDPSKAPTSAAVEFTPLPVDPDASPVSVASADIHADWAFDIRGINGPRRLTLVRAPDGWALEQIRVNGSDATDRPIAFGRAEQSLSDVEVVLTDRVSELAGTVKAAELKTVVVFSTDRGRWYPSSRFLRLAAIRDGAFQIVGLPFGTYYVAAIKALPPEGEDAWQSSDFLEAVARLAETATVREGEKTVLRLGR